jgi:hypothetical protein
VDSFQISHSKSYLNSEVDVPSPNRARKS